MERVDPPVLRQFIDRLLAASEPCRALAESLGAGPLPSAFEFVFVCAQSLGGTMPDGRFKLHSGRFTTLAEVSSAHDAVHAGKLMWSHGVWIPVWVNVCVTARTASQTRLALCVSDRWCSPDPLRLSRDRGAPPENPLAPFRIRGPSAEEVRAIAGGAR